jgi:hypothetical protein
MGTSIDLGALAPFVLGGLVALSIGGFVGRSLGRSRGRAELGLWLGLVLSVVGWIVIACLPKRQTLRIVPNHATLNHAQMAALDGLLRVPEAAGRH